MSSSNTADLPAGAPRPTTVAVMGSCITRDNFNTRFNPGYKRWFECVQLQNQSSLISVMAEPVEATWEPTKEFQPEGLRRIASEFDKSFLADLRELQPEYLVIDLFGDVRFGVVQVDDGSWLTDNAWTLWFTDWFQQMRADGRLRRVRPFTDTEEYLALWRDAAHRLDAFLRAELPHTTVVVHRGRNTNQVVKSGRTAPGKLSKEPGRARKDRRANAFWQERDLELAEILGAEVIDLSAAEHPATEDHPWGPSPVHWSMDYYPLFLAELHRLHLQRTAPDDVADRVGEIVTAHRDGAAAERERYRAGEAALRAKLERRKEKQRALQARVEELTGGSRLRRVWRALRD